jgi:hypothetical protein
MRVDESFRYVRGNSRSTLINSHQLSWNSCSRLTGVWELRKLSCKLSLLNYLQLSSLFDQGFRKTDLWPRSHATIKQSCVKSFELGPFWAENRMKMPPLGGTA